jgi:hypothetical protein
MRQKAATKLGGLSLGVNIADCHRHIDLRQRCVAPLRFNGGENKMSNSYAAVSALIFAAGARELLDAEKVSILPLK